MELARMVSLALNRLGLRMIDGRLWRWSRLEAESRRVFSAVDRTRFEELIEQYPAEAEKRKARDNGVLLVYLAHVLGLQKAVPPLRILDTGSKAGMFPFVARAYGHDAWASDLPEVLQRRPNADFIELLKVPAVPLKIEAFKPLPPFERRFDLITGFRTRFHSRYRWETGKDHEEHWGVGEWDFFLRDLAANHLTEPGRIFFWVNRLQERERGRIIPRALAQYFLRMGARIWNDHLYFPSADRLRRHPPVGAERGP